MNKINLNEVVKILPQLAVKHIPEMPTKYFVCINDWDEACIGDNHSFLFTINSDGEPWYSGRDYIDKEEIKKDLKTLLNTQSRPLKCEVEEKWNENVEKCSECGIEWKKIGKSCPVCFAPAEKKLV